MSTVIDPKNSLAQSGVFYEMVKPGINILNKDFYKWNLLFLIILSHVSTQAIKAEA